MLRKLGLSFLIAGIVCFPLASIIIDLKFKSIFILIISISIALTFLGISFLVIHSKKINHYKAKSIFLALSLVLITLCILSAYNNWIGANIEGFIAIFSYCFAYAPIELHTKNNKWRAYSNNSLEILLLSTLDFVGVNLILLGILTKALHWPGQFYIMYPGIGLLILGVFLWNSRFKREVIRRKESEDKIKIQYAEIEKAKQVSEKLLLNILPFEVAEELKAKSSSEAKQFDEVTVLFTDFKDFTKVSEKMSAKELVEEINTCFMAFDKIIENYGIEKIKTIGDSYMCAGGLPVANNTHAIDVVNASLDIQKFIQERAKTCILENKESFQIRIGIHTGPVVAGIVGIKKYAYDIWGDTVNTASRMESGSEVGMINISATTYNLVKDRFTITRRGKILTKGKGELEMYFVNGRKYKV
jgi:class 3 adenylate cyclase